MKYKKSDIDHGKSKMHEEYSQLLIDNDDWFYKINNVQDFIFFISIMYRY